eukprot:Nk52_evm2s2192 gene=Nk52_evmTU2s2192
MSVRSDDEHFDSDISSVNDITEEQYFETEREIDLYIETMTENEKQWFNKRVSARQNEWQKFLTSLEERYANVIEEELSTVHEICKYVQLSCKVGEKIPASIP